MLIPVVNPETTEYEKSYLMNPYSVGVTSIDVKNNDRFAANYRIMIGEMGQEKTEVVTVSAINANGTGVTIGATVFPHSADDPVYVLQFDQVKYYRSTTGATGTYSLIAGTPVNLDVDNANLQTIFDDTAGVSTNYYKVSMYHSISTLESALSDAIPGGGFTRRQVGNIIDEILQEVSDPNQVHITRGELIGYFNDVNDDLLTNVHKPYDFLHTRTTLARVAGQNYLAFPTDSNGYQSMWAFDRMDYEFTDSTTTPVTDNTYTLKVWPEAEFRNTFQNNTFSSTNESDQITDISLDTAVDRFRINPAPLTNAGAAFYLYYWKYFTQIDSEGDVIETPTPKIYKLYAKMMYYQKRAIADVTLSNTAQAFASQYAAEKARYKTIDRKDAGTPRDFRPMTDTMRNYRR